MSTATLLPKKSTVKEVWMVQGELMFHNEINRLNCLWR